MPKQFTAQSVQSVNPLQWVWKDGQLVQILVGCEVNYGELGMTHQVDILPDLTPEQRTRAEQIYQRIRYLVEVHFLG